MDLDCRCVCARILKTTIVAFIAVFIFFSFTACKDNNSIVGKWETTGTGTIGTFEFKSNKQFVSSTINSAGEEVKTEGTYRIEGNKLIIDPTEYDEEECIFEVNGNSLVLLFDTDPEHPEAAAIMEFIRKR